MRTCTICQSAAELDDIVLTLSTDGCICLRCYSRETGSTRRMPAGLRHALEEILAVPATPHRADPVPSLVRAMESDVAWFPRDWKPWWQTLRGSA